jgi:phage tail tape-measure protein
MSKEATPEQASALEPDIVQTPEETALAGSSHAVGTASVASGALAGAMAGAVAGPLAAITGGIIGGAIGIAAGIVLDGDAHAETLAEDDDPEADEGDDSTRQRPA